MKANYYIILLPLFLTACSSVRVHSGKAILLEQNHCESNCEITNLKFDKEKPFLVVSDNLTLFGNNPIYIANGGKFSVRLKAINPGWLNRESQIKLGEKLTFSDEYTELQEKNIGGKELWLLTTVKSLDTSDPLETNSKVYYKSSNVKLGSSAFSLVPIDSDEEIIFTHLADSSYRFEFRLYEVDNLELKREIINLKNTAGIQGLLVAATESVKKITSGIFGEWLDDLFSDYIGEPQAFERLLLKSGATLEFQGKVTLVRKNDFYSRYSFNPTYTGNELNVSENSDEGRSVSDPDCADKINLTIECKKDPFLAKSDYLLFDFVKHSKSNGGTFENVNYSNEKDYHNVIDELKKMCFYLYKGNKKPVKCKGINISEGPFIWLSVIESIGTGELLKGSQTNSFNVAWGSIKKAAEELKKDHSVDRDKYAKIIELGRELVEMSIDSMGDATSLKAKLEEKLIKNKRAKKAVSSLNNFMANEKFYWDAKNKYFMIKNSNELGIEEYGIAYKEYSKVLKKYQRLEGTVFDDLNIEDEDMSKEVDMFQEYVSISSFLFDVELNKGRNNTELDLIKTKSRKSEINIMDKNKNTALKEKLGHLKEWVDFMRSKED